MIRSMTAYGRGEFTLDKMTFIAEIKSVNNRYRDVILRIPKALLVFEDEIRSYIFSRIRRGRIEVSIQVEKNGAEPGYNLELNLPLVESYLRIFRHLSEEFGLDKPIGPDYLCQMKDVIIVKSEDEDSDRVRSGLQEVLKRAIDSLNAMRLREGEAIEEDFRTRLQRIEEGLDDIKNRAPLVVEHHRRKLTERIDQILPDVEIDENRLLQEVAIFAERSDITEEIVRTGSHLKQFHHYMTINDAVGRRLDFLVQEINREINTISAKASDSSISAGVVEIKAELEKLREQIQNVE